MSPKDPATRRALANASRALSPDPAAAGMLAAAVDDVVRSRNRTPADAAELLEHVRASLVGAGEPYLLELRAQAFRLVADVDHALATRAERRAAAELAP